MSSYKIEKASLPPGLDWLSTISKPLERDLTATGKVVEFPPNNVIGQRGEGLNFLISVLSGAVDLYATAAGGKRVMVGSRGPGSMIGWLSVIDGKPLDYELVTRSETKLLLIPIALAKELLLTCRSLATRVLGDMAKTLREIAAEKQVLSAPNAQQRVYIHLLNLVTDQSGSNSAHRLPKQEEIAKQINTSRETVSRALQLLVKSGVILKRGHQIEVKKIDLLKKIADGELHEDVTGS